MAKEPDPQQPPGPPAKHRPSSMGSILRRTTGRGVPSSAPLSGEVPPGEATMEAEESRRLADVPWAELEQAMTELCARLGVPGSVDGLYDLYAATAAEWGKAHRARE
jgi:hypothetical protein